MTDKAPRHPAEGLSVAARYAFEQIAVGVGRKHPPAAIRELLDADLIEPAGPKAFEVPIPVHIAFCEWCSKQEPL